MGRDAVWEGMTHLIIDFCQGLCRRRICIKGRVFHAIFQRQVIQFDLNIPSARSFGCSKAGIYQVMKHDWIRGHEKTISEFGQLLKQDGISPEYLKFAVD